MAVALVFNTPLLLPSKFFRILAEIILSGVMAHEASLKVREIPAQALFFYRGTNVTGSARIIIYSFPPVLCIVGWCSMLL
jgi:hypothetical protein